MYEWSQRPNPAAASKVTSTSNSKKSSFLQQRPSNFNRLSSIHKSTPNLTAVTSSGGKKGIPPAASVDSNMASVFSAAETMAISRMSAHDEQILHRMNSAAACKFSNKIIYITISTFTSVRPCGVSVSIVSYFIVFFRC